MTSFSLARSLPVARALPVALGLALALVGCSPKRSSQPFPPMSSNAGSDFAATAMPVEEWPFVPAAVRIHPLTRILTGDVAAESVVETRIEFADRWGDTTKAVGRLQLDLYGSDGNEDAPLTPVHRWEQDLTNLDLNRAHYDQVTRTYLFKLGLTEPLPPRVELIVTLQMGEQSLTASRRLRQQ